MPSTRHPRTQGTSHQLIRLLRALDGSGYRSYQRASGQWDYGDFQVCIDRVQADPYAPPSSIRIVAELPDLPEWGRAARDQQVASADFLARALHRHLDGAVSIARPGQEILERSSVTVGSQRVEARLQVNLPARGRTVLGRQAAQIFEVDLPRAIRAALELGDASALRRHVWALEDHRALQGLLTKNNWVGFVADGAILARESGVSPLPLTDAIAFDSPAGMRATVTLPHVGTVTGMALPTGITVIVGGGFHGKSTLLGALQEGVYPHVPGDGRELVAALPDAVKLRAADGRPIASVDVSSFINHLPHGADTRRFSTANASGSTSQAAALMEAVSGGSTLLLLDEDTSATNLLIRDARMRALVPPEQEPITPLVDRIRALAAAGVSTVMVMGGSGDYLDVADQVLQMESYHCQDRRDRAAAVVREFPRERGDLEGFPLPAPRAPQALSAGGGRAKTRAHGVEKIQLDRELIDLADVEQIVDPGQTEAIAWAVRGLTETLADGAVPLEELAEAIIRRVDDEGLDALATFGGRRYPAFLVRPRRVDLIAAVNRYRRLEIT